jgi:hypothetical protein
MSALLWVALVVAVLICMLAIPFELQFRFALGKQADRHVRLVWAFGLARVSLPSDKLQRANRAGKPGSDEPAGDRKGSSGTTARALRVFSDTKLRRRMMRYFGAVWRAIDKRDLLLRARIGLGDPADTGQLWAIAGPVAAALSSIRDASVSIRPDFYDEVVEMDTSGRITVIPLQLIGLTLPLLLSPRLIRCLLRK